ncbi:phage holin family protein [Protaetiibacter mangrovi]|uniref:Phage holin family protein n=1 Tax=Protaetiibacter mangrovi TaxID=2970926 RepID=A0ABT1ZCD8_9MICO|nr:phage holin family protein [Protaetiibacter mangrovi]MCS0498368.1 phage holin family protein [Protaetiibacter mangrovi]TPW92524.1 phage holin family protein [Schumannella luteola]
MTDPTAAPPPRKRSLVELLTSLPEQVQELVQREIELVKTELIEKLKALGVGAGLLLGAVVTLLFFIGVLLTLAIIGLSYVMPDWAAALVVAGVLLIIAVILGLVGYRIMMRGIPPVPTEAIESIQKDVLAIKGEGRRGTDE